MKIFFDLEFTGLKQHTTPVSIALITESGEYFYAEFTDYDISQLDRWLIDNVVRSLELERGFYENVDGNIKMSNTRNFIVAELEDWLKDFSPIQIWGVVYS